MTNTLISKTLDSLGIDPSPQPSTQKHISEPGQAIVLIALMLVGLIAIAGLVLDGGNAYAQRRFMQNAADAGAFAGTRVLATRNNNGATTECAIRFAIETFAKSNGVPGSAPDPTCNQLNTNVKAYFLDSSGNQTGAEIGLNLGVPNGATGVRVLTNATFNTFLLGLVGEGTGSAAARAAVQSGELTGSTGLMPLTVKQETVESQCEPNKTNCRLLGETTGPGNFQWLDFQTKSQGNGNNCGNPNEQYLGSLLDQTISSGYVQVNTWVCGSPGKKVGNGVTDGIDSWWNKALNDRYWIIPVYDTVTGQGNNFEYHITGFAVFRPAAYDFGGKQGGDLNLCIGQGSSKCIEGTFLRWATSGDFKPYTICRFGGCGIGAVE